MGLASRVPLRKLFRLQLITPITMTEISIVGGGITGLAVAYSANKPVSVFEASSKPGGILRDLNSNGYSFFRPVNILMGGLLGFIGWDYTAGFLSLITVRVPLQTSLEKSNLRLICWSNL